MADEASFLILIRDEGAGGTPTPPGVPPAAPAPRVVTPYTPPMWGGAAGVPPLAVSAQPPRAGGGSSASDATAIENQLRLRHASTAYTSEQEVTWMHLARSEFKSLMDSVRKDRSEMLQEDLRAIKLERSEKEEMLQEDLLSIARERSEKAEMLREDMAAIQKERSEREEMLREDLESIRRVRSERMDAIREDLDAIRREREEKAEMLQEDLESIRRTRAEKSEMLQEDLASIRQERSEREEMLREDLRMIAKERTEKEEMLREDLRAIQKERAAKEEMLREDLRMIAKEKAEQEKLRQEELKRLRDVAGILGQLGMPNLGKALGLAAGGANPISVAIAGMTVAFSVAEKGVKQFGESAAAIASGDAVGLARSFGSLAGQIPIVGGMFQGMVNAGLDAMEGMTAQARRLARYDAGLAMAVAQFDVNQILRDIQTAPQRAPALIRGMAARETFQIRMEQIMTDRLPQIITFIEFIIDKLPPLVELMMGFFQGVVGVIPGLAQLGSYANRLQSNVNDINGDVNRILGNMNANQAAQDGGVQQALDMLSPSNLIGGAGVPRANQVAQPPAFQQAQFPAFGGL